MFYYFSGIKSSNLILNLQWQALFLGGLLPLVSVVKWGVSYNVFIDIGFLSNVVISLL